MTSDDILAELLSSLELEEPQVDNVELMADVELMATMNDVTEQLRALGQLLQATTDEGRELHSRRGALEVAMRARGLR